MLFQITVSRVPEEPRDLSATEAVQTHMMPVVVFSQMFPEQDFDVNAFAIAINKRKRVRKARGKEA